MRSPGEHTAETSTAVQCGGDWRWNVGAVHGGRDEGVGPGVNEAVPPALELVNVSKSFPGVLALRDVSLSLQAGSVHALCGENGAGKSTLIKVATGAETCDRGELRIAGQRVDRPKLRHVQAMGVRAIFQERQIAMDLSVTENVLLDRLPTRLGRIDWGHARAVAARRLAQLDIALDVDAPVRSLTVAQLQMIEIARAVSSDARVVVMDEPTASLSRHELGPLFGVIDRLRTAGVAVLFISHHLDEVFAVADEVTVMRDGEVVDARVVGDFTSDEVVQAMFGRSVDGRRNEQSRSARSFAPRLCLEQVVTGRLDGVDVQVGAGEIVGVAGGVGAGVSELAAVASGATRVHSGEVVAIADDGTRRPLRTRRKALRLGAAFLPADRKRQGLLLDRALTDNIVLGVQAEGRSVLFAPRVARRIASRLAVMSNVKAANIDVVVGTLSGGNQQKVMIGRWLGVDSSILVLDEPTAGIDIASKFEIYAALRRLADDGAAVLICSTDFQEIGQVADRVLVMKSGRIIGEVDGPSASEHRLLEIEMAS